MTAKLLFFAGSARKDSFNKKLAKYASDYAASKGADVTYIDLRDFEMPLFCEDLEAEKGLPEAAVKLKKLIAESDGFFISTPEYNSLMPALLKNTLDWCTRGEGGVFKGKVAGIASATPGALGGIRGLPVLRSMLQNILVHVVPQMMAFGMAGKDISEDGSEITDEGKRAMLHGVVDQLIEMAEKLKA